MTTVIDAFVATLGLDGTLFRRGMDDATKAQKKLADASTRGNGQRERQERQLADNQRRRQTQQDAHIKSTVEGYKKIRNELLSIAAVFTVGVGIKDFITDTINSAAGLGYLSANLRLSTKELSSWQRASERAGGSKEGIIAQLKESQDTLAQLKSGMGPNEGVQSFFRWGGNSDELKDGNSYLLARSRIIHDMFKADPAQAALIAKSMGISEDQFNFIKQGPDAVLALVHAQDKNAAITEKDADAALKLKNKMLDLKDSLQATATRIVLQLAPALERVFAKLEEGANWVQDHKEDIAKWVDSAITAVGKFLVMADKFATAVGGWQNVLMGVAAAPVIAGLVSIAAAVGAVVAAGAGIPALVAALGVVAAYSGYGAAKALDKKFGSGEGRDRRMHADIMRGGTGMGEEKPIEELRREAARQRAGGGSKQEFYGKIKPMAGAPAVTSGSVVDKLKAMGWSAEQAAGIAGSFMQESGMDPSARNPTSGAYGIGQWLGSRVGDFKAFSGKDLKGSSLDEQLAFFNHETSKNGKESRAGDLLRGARTAEDAARIHSEAYERPGEAEANIARRQRLAAQMAAADRLTNAGAAGALPAGAVASVGNSSSRSSTNTTETKIESINVYTQATDAQGIAAAMRPAVEKYTFATQANSGMQ